jgi:hypothetical protein
MQANKLETSSVSMNNPVLRWGLLLEEVTYVLGVE